MEKISEIITKIPKEEIQRLKSLPGETIGMGLIEDIRFILDQEGKKGLELLEQGLAELGLVQYQKIENFKWYSVGHLFIPLLLIKEIFNWDEEKFREMGASAVKVSLITRMMMRYFISIRRCFEEAPRYWSMYLTAGKMNLLEINEKEKYFFFSIEDLPGHQLFCRYLEGFIKQVVSYMVKEPECREVKCCLLGQGENHLFKVTWK